MVLILGLITTIVTQILKSLVAKYGTIWVQLMVLVVAFVVAYLWTLWGGYIDWQLWASVSGLAIGYYELFIKRFWSGK